MSAPVTELVGCATVFKMSPPSPSSTLPPSSVTFSITLRLDVKIKYQIPPRPHTVLASSRYGVRSHHTTQTPALRAPTASSHLAAATRPAHSAAGAPSQSPQLPQAAVATANATRSLASTVYTLNAHINWSYNFIPWQYTLFIVFSRTPLLGCLCSARHFFRFLHCPAFVK
jgi:hypothetical protein